MRSFISIITATFFLFSIISCNDDAIISCEDANTGTITIKNDGDYMPSGNADFYIGTQKVATIAKGSEKTVDGINVGTQQITIVVLPDTIYTDMVTIAQCETLNYSTNEYQPASDQRLKKNINPIDNALSFINQLVPYTYEYKTLSNSKQYLPKGIHYGYMAQDLLNVFPSFVQLNDDGYYSVNYVEIIPVLTKGIQEQQLQIDDFKNEI
ncbi:MAG: tail fiber domain-containing protein [Chitinophagales bacterium]